jgi:hypothetical protein
MLQSGIRGTFYLNSRKPEKPEGSLARKLAKDGKCSVGGHSVSHPKLPQLPANDSFYQLMANRIALECLTDQPVNSLAFPYGQFQAKGRPEVKEGVSECVLRTGYLHCVYRNFVERNKYLPEGTMWTGNQVVPGDRKVDADKFWQTMDKFRKFEDKYRQTSNCIFLGVHPWQNTEEQKKLHALMTKLHDWDDFWCCTQTEWAAYCKQRHDTKLDAKGAGVYEVTRPAAFDLGNDIPMTLVFDSTTIQSATVDGVACPIRKADGKTYVNVPHAKAEGVPTTIGKVDGKGVCGKFPGLTGSLAFDAAADTVTFTIKNGTDKALSDGVLTISLPPACEPGMVRWECPTLAAGKTWSVTRKLARTRKGEYWEKGKPYFAARFDFRENDARSRLFAETFGAATE